MDDKNEQIYSQYQLEILSIYKVRGLIYLETQQGLYIIKPYNYSETRAKADGNLKNALCKKGFKNIDILIKNNLGSYITQNRYGNKYVIKKWFNGNECDITSLCDLKLASRNLAAFHKIARNIELDEEDTCRIPTRRIIDEYDCYNSELKRVKKYIYGKKKKNSLEMNIIQCIDYFYSQAIKYSEELRKSNYLKLYSESIENKWLCHGSYNHHSVILCNDSVATINFERVNYGVQIYDLYCLLRKAMEKNDWDIDIGRSIIETYNEEKSILKEEKEILYIFIAYPEKYRKLVNSYFNGKKAWVSIRITEKLDELIKLEEKKNKFLEQYRKYYL